MWWNKKKWYVVTSSETGDSLSVYRYGRRMTRKEVIKKIKDEMEDFPMLFTVFSASRLSKSGIGNAYNIDEYLKKMTEGGDLAEVVSGMSSSIDDRGFN